MSSVVSINIQNNPECLPISLPRWLSHDLMQPVNALVLTAQGISGQIFSGDVPEASIRTIVKSATLIDTMLWSFREYLRLDNEGSPPCLETVKLADIATKLQGLGLQLSPGKTLILNGFDDLAIISSHVLLDTIVHCLYSNAAKYAKKTVSVSAKAMAGFVRLNFKDDGPGVDEKILERIGMPFNRTVGSDGLGLGIYLATRIAGKLDHRIEFESSSGGCQFSIIMKQADGMQVNRSKNAIVHDVFFGKKILVMDGNRLFSEALGKTFKSWGGDVVYADGTGAALCDISNRIDIVVASVDIWKLNVDESQALIVRFAPAIVLLSSDFDENLEAFPWLDEIKSHTKFLFIRRPFSPIRIKRVLGSLLAKIIV